MTIGWSGADIWGLMYNMHVTQAAVADTRSPAFTRTAPRIPLAGLAALAVIVTVGVMAIRFGAGPDLESHQTGPFRFEAPAAWSVREARAGWTGGSSHAIISTVPIPTSCGIDNVDVNCYYAQKPPPSSVSIILLTSSPLIRTDDRESYLDAVRSHGHPTELGGLEAYRIDHEIAPNDYYRSDLAVAWLVPQSAAADSFWVIDAKVRGPGADELMRLVERLVASMQIAP